VTFQIDDKGRMISAYATAGTPRHTVPAPPKASMADYRRDRGLPPLVDKRIEPREMHPEDVAAIAEGTAYGETHGEEFFRCRLAAFSALVSTYSDADAEKLLAALREEFWAQEWKPAMTTPNSTAATVDIDELEALAKAPSVHQWWRASTLTRTLVDGLGLADAAFISAVRPRVVLALIAELRAHRAEAEAWTAIEAWRVAQPGQSVDPIDYYFRPPGAPEFSGATRVEALTKAASWCRSRIAETRGSGASPKPPASPVLDTEEAR
jgi:hypothetical protein